MPIVPAAFTGALAGLAPSTFFGIGQVISIVGNLIAGGPPNIQGEVARITQRLSEITAAEGGVVPDVATRPDVRAALNEAIESPEAFFFAGLGTPATFIREAQVTARTQRLKIEGQISGALAAASPINLPRAAQPRPLAPFVFGQERNVRRFAPREQNVRDRCFVLGGRVFCRT